MFVDACNKFQTHNNSIFFNYSYIYLQCKCMEQLSSFWSTAWIISSSPTLESLKTHKKIFWAYVKALVWESEGFLCFRISLFPVNLCWAYRARFWEQRKGLRRHQRLLFVRESQFQLDPSTGSHSGTWSIPGEDHSGGSLGDITPEHPWRRSPWSIPGGGHSGEREGALMEAAPLESPYRNRFSGRTCGPLGVYTGAACS